MTDFEKECRHTTTLPENGGSIVHVNKQDSCAPIFRGFLVLKK
jgi:hypothetical protein